MQTIWRHRWSNLHNRKTSISLERKKIFQKEKHHSSVFWKGFQISTSYFSLNRHFKTQSCWLASEWCRCPITAIQLRKEIDACYTCTCSLIFSTSVTLMKWSNQEWNFPYHFHWWCNSSKARRTVNIFSWRIILFVIYMAFINQTMFLKFMLFNQTCFGWNIIHRQLYRIKWSCAINSVI